MKINAVIVDDEKLIADGFKLSFQKDFPNVNFNVFYFSDDVLSYAKNNHIDLLICDIDMPGINGIELAKKLKSEYSKLQILFLTGMNTFDYVYKASDVSDSLYVLKIEEQGIINNKIETLLNNIVKAQDFINDFVETKNVNDALVQEKVEKNFFHIIMSGANLYESDLFNDKSFFVCKFSEKNEQKDLENMCNLLSTKIDVKSENIIVFDERTIMFVKEFKKINDLLFNELKEVQEIIHKEYGLNFSVLYTSQVYQENEYFNIYKKINDLFLMTNINDGYVHTYEELIGDSCSDNVKIIAKIKDYIWNHMDDDISLKKISDILYYNESYLSRLFKKLTGNNFKDFTTNLKIEKAKYLLRNSTMLIKDICKNLGFDSPSHFQFFFRKHLGMTPLEYRRNIEINSNNNEE